MKRLAAVLAGAALAACATPPPSAPEAEARVDTYYPLAVGNSWFYKGAYLGQAGTREVLITGRADGFFQDNQGGELLVDSLGLRDRKRYLLRAPIKKGTAWTNVTAISSVERYEITEVGFVDAVDAGRFENCVRVRATNRLDARTELVNELTYAPHVGLIRIQTTARIEGKGEVPQVSMELVKFTAGKGT